MTNLKQTKILVLLFLIFSFIACQNQSNDKGKKIDKPEINGTNGMDTISVATFNDWTSNWTRINGNFRDSIVRSFTMPIVDLTNVVGHKPAQSRFYLGVDTLTNPYTPHLMVVGVDSSGVDMIDYARGLYVYDVSTPCPPFCGGKMTN